MPRPESKRVARKGNTEELKRHGAHLVVDDLGELVE
jgi:hypothetical protein